LAPAKSWCVYPPKEGVKFCHFAQRKNKKSKDVRWRKLMEKDLLYGKIITFKYPRLSTKDIILKLYHLVKEKNAF